MVHYFDNLTTSAIDHNLYTRGDCAFEANYRAGLSILDISGVGAASISEVAYFDIYPGSDAAAFNGAWSNYPYFPSGTVVVSGIEQGLFVLTPDLDPVLSDGADCSPPAAPESPAVVEAHVGDLDAMSAFSTKGNSWTAEVTIAIHDENHAAVPDALVTGTWDVKGQNTGSCVTDEFEFCVVIKDKIKASKASVTFTVDTVRPESGGYDPGANDVTDNIAVSAP